MRIKMVEFANRVPSCTDEQTFDRWKESARHLPPTAKVGFCEDCTFDYQLAMKAQKRCENPWIVFKEDEDGFEHGTIAEEEND